MAVFVCFFEALPLRANPRAGRTGVLRGAAHYLGDLCAYRVVTRTERVVRVAARHAVAHPGLHEGKERAALQHIRKGSQGRIEDVPTEHLVGGVHNDLGQLAPGDVRVGPEVRAGARLAGTTAVVTGHNLIVRRGFHESVEGAAGGYVVERGRAAGRHDGYAQAQHGYLGKLAAGGVVERAERAVRVARNSTPAGDAAHV